MNHKIVFMSSLAFSYWQFHISIASGSEREVLHKIMNHRRLAKKSVTSTERTDDCVKAQAELCEKVSLLDGLFSRLKTDALTSEKRLCI